MRGRKAGGIKAGRLRQDGGHDIRSRAYATGERILMRAGQAGAGRRIVKPGTDPEPLRRHRVNRKCEFGNRELRGGFAAETAIAVQVAGAGWFRTLPRR